MAFKAFLAFCAQFNEVMELTNEGIPQQPLMASLIFSMKVDQVDLNTKTIFSSL
jgi:hypothetical protein